MEFKQSAIELSNEDLGAQYGRLTENFNNSSTLFTGGGYRTMGSAMLVSLCVVFSSYGLVSWHEKSLMHYLTPIVPLLFVTVYVLPWAYMNTYGPFGSPYAYVYYYGTQAIVVLTSAVIYCFIRAPHVGWKPDTVPVKRMHWVFLLVSVLVFLPILIKYSSLLTNPRVIYQETRSGEGIYYFTSSFFLNLAFIFFLFVKNRKFIPSVLFIATIVVLSLMHGSKGQLLAFFWFWLLYIIYVERKRISIKRTFAMLSIPIVLMGSLFIFFQGAKLEGLLVDMAQYSDYARNAMLVIDDHSINYQYGLVTLENTIFSRVPRSIFPNKPEGYGQFAIASRYYSGSPGEVMGEDFSIGVQYYDFGPFAVFYLVAWSAFTTYLLKGFIEKSKEGQSRANFVLIAFFAGIGLMPIGISYLLPEHVILAYLMAVQGRVKIKFL